MSVLLQEHDERCHLGHCLLVRVSDELVAKTVDEDPKVIATVLLKPEIVPRHVLLTERVEDISVKHRR
jgi:hypothetical protein